MSSFDELRDRPSTELEALLRAPDAPTRLYAAWALALRAATTTGELALHLEREPNEGVRAHLVNVVAGPAHRELLRTLAEHDTSALVRAAACRVLARGADPELADWLDGRARDDASPDVRTAIDDARGRLPPDPVPEPPERELVPARIGEPRGGAALELRAFHDLASWIARWRGTARYSAARLQAIERLPGLLERTRSDELRAHRDALVAIERELDQMLLDREASEEDPADVEPPPPSWREARDAIANALGLVR